MDPTACLADILTCLSTGQPEDAIDSMSYLVEWLTKDGYLPNVTEAAEAAGIVTR
jgi:hypothetical protein